MSGPVSVTCPTLNSQGATTPRIYPLRSTFLDGQIELDRAELVILVAF
jgi:hypothetical protein